MQDLTKLIDQAINASRNWHVTGWTMEFGQNPGRKVCNLEEAQKLERTFVYRIEAVAYWDRIKGAGEECCGWGEKAKAAVARGDLHDADDSVYAALHTERFIHESAPTWGDVWHKVRGARQSGGKG